MHSSTHPHDAAPPPADRRVAEGVGLAKDGRYEEAEAIFRDVLAESAGSGSETESRACLNLGTLYGILGRCLEALLLYRHGLQIAQAQGHALASVIYLANIGGIYVQLGMHSRLPRVLGRIERALAGLSGAERDQAERYATWQRYEVASWEGDTLGARRALDRIRAEFGGDDDPRVRSAVHEIESHELAEQGHLDEAIERLDAALSESGLTTTSHLDLLCHKAVLLGKAGYEDEAKAVGADALELLAEGCDREAWSEESIGAGKVLASLFVRATDHARARRAFDLVAAAIMRRIHQLDACIQDLPALGIHDAADRTWIGDLRHEFETEQDELRARVLRLLEDARRRGESPVHGVEADDDLVRICAWCGMVRSHQGRWVPIRHYLPADEHLKVTHTICSACDRSLGAGPVG